jgi:serine/threonine protein kinase
MDISPGDIVDDRYEVTRVLESGAHGCVVDAQHTRLGQPFTLEIVRGDLDESSEPVRRLHQKGRATSLVQHENAVFVTDVGRCSRFGYYLVTERRRGVPLSELLRERGRLGLLEAVRIGMDAGHAVASAHEVGVVHRGLHPDNLLVEGDESTQWTCKVMGFGVGGQVIDESSAPGAAHADSQAPELRLGAAPDAKSDQFSLGAIVYTMLTGQMPDRGELDNDELRPPSAFVQRVPRELDQAVLVSLRRSPQRRHDSVEAFVDALVSPATQRLEPRSDPWDEVSLARDDEVMTEVGMGLSAPTEPPSLIIEFDEVVGSSSGARERLSLTFQTHERLRREYRRNIVAGGVFVPTDREFSLQDRVELEVALDGEAPVRVDAEVVNVHRGSEQRSSGVGLSLDTAAVEALGKYVRTRSGLDLRPDDVVEARVPVEQAEGTTRAGAFLISRLAEPRSMAELRREVEGLPFDLDSELTALTESGFVEVQSAENSESAEGLATEAPTEARVADRGHAGALVDFDTSAPWDEPPTEGLDESSRIDYTDSEVERVMALVDYQVRRQNYLAAMRTLQKAIVVSPSVARFHHRLARLRLQFTGDKQAAMQSLERARRLAPDDPDILETLRRVESESP